MEFIGCILYVEFCSLVYVNSELRAEFTLCSCCLLLLLLLFARILYRSNADKVQLCDLGERGRDLFTSSWFTRHYLS
jgi:hypothetical protein